jgi:hypothetical protein
VNVKVKKHVSEPGAELVAYGFFCFGVASEYIDVRHVLCGNDQSKYISSEKAINSSVLLSLDLGFQYCSFAPPELWFKVRNCLCGYHASSSREDPDHAITRYYERKKCPMRFKLIERHWSVGI